MKLRNSLLIPLALLLSGVVGLLTSGALMAQRLSDRKLPLVWFEHSIYAQDFSFLHHPVQVRVEETEPTAVENKTLTIEFREQTIRIPIEHGMLDDPRLPGLKRFEDWLRIVPMATGAHTETEVQQRLNAGTLTPKLLVAVRMPAEGYDPESWGLVRRKDWRYRFALLDAEAPAESCITQSAGLYSELELLGDPTFRRENGREDEVWKFYAMLQVTPATAYRSKNRPLAEVMGVMGWTWSVAGLSVMVIIVGAAGLALRSRTPPAF